MELHLPANLIHADPTINSRLHQMGLMRISIHPYSAFSFIHRTAYNVRSSPLRRVAVSR